ncbi:hypothetical protein [Cystobacter ferrugineus]|nr:hypothetical protein [Cystobacter ferrugineus]
MVKSRPLTQGEWAGRYEEPPLRERTLQAKQEHEAHFKQALHAHQSDTWFYPALRRQTRGAYDVVLGWNHALVLRPLDLHLYAVEWILRYSADEQHRVHGGMGIDVHEAGTQGPWTVYAVRPKAVLRRVTTYNATSCSVSVLFPESGQGRMVISHIDATPPIPFGAALAWCEAHDEKVVHLERAGLTNTRAWRAFCSICPDTAEVAKFKDGVCLSDGTSPGSSSAYGSGRTISSLLLTRGKLIDHQVCPMEFNTQAGLVFERGRVPLFRVFLGSPPHLYPGLVPESVKRDIASVVAQYRRQQPLNELILRKQRELAALNSTFFDLQRRRKAEELGRQQREAEETLEELQFLLKDNAPLPLLPLLDDTHGHARLHQAICQRFADRPPLTELARTQPSAALTLAFHQALTEPESVASQMVGEEIRKYFRCVDFPLTPRLHQALWNLPR